MLVRTLGKADTIDFWHLRLSALRDAPELFGSTVEENQHRSLADVAGRELREEPGHFVVGAFTPELVGVAGLTRDPRKKRRHRANLWGMYVSPAARGLGVGRALVGEIIARARAEGVEQIILTVMAHNAPAIGLYRAFGFESYGHAPRAMILDGRAFDEELMRLVV